MMIHGEGEVLVPAHLNFGRFVLDRMRRAEPGRPCLKNCESGEQLTFAEFSQYAIRLASALAQLGVSRGDVVAVGGEPRVTFLPTGLAVILTGAAYTPIFLNCGSASLTHRLNITKPKYFICSRRFWEAYSSTLRTLDYTKTYICFDDIDDIELSVKDLVSQNLDVDAFEPAVVKGDDVAFIMYSSGTTGKSKGVLITHLSSIARCDTQGWYGFDSLQTAYTSRIYPAGSYSTFSLYRFLCAGKTVVCSEDHLDLKVIDEYKVDAMITYPTIVVGFLNADKDKYDLSSLKTIYSCGTPLHLSLAKAFKERHPNIELINIYGLTEAHIITSPSPSAVATATVGVAAPGVTIKVVDIESRSILGPNQRGEVCVRSPFLMKGYLGTTSPYLDEQGFYLTGDVGYYDEHKQFYLVDRLSDIIPHEMGYKIYPVDLEDVLLSHPAVSEAAVVGAPVRIGEQPVAFVVLRPGASITEAEVQDYVDSKVTLNMKLTGGVRFVPDLPRNAGQKILRRRLREMLA